MYIYTNMAMLTEASWSSDSLIYTKITNPDEYISVTFSGLANCQADSMDLYAKLYKAGAKRVRGKRSLERALKEDKRHYWCENQDKVFNFHGGILQIVDKDYFEEDITDKEYADYGMFFKDELDSEVSSSEKYKLLFKNNSVDWKGLANVFRMKK